MDGRATSEMDAAWRAYVMQAPNGEPRSNKRTFEAGWIMCFNTYYDGEVRSSGWTNLDE